MHSLVEGIPFLGIILSISILPLINHNFWHYHARKILFIWVLIYLGIALNQFGCEYTIQHVFGSVVKQYIPFVLLVASLFITTGGIFIDFHRLKKGPITNTCFLLGGSLVAGWIGTTGASALLIRPFLRLNEGRKSRVHLVMFFIFLVSNIGGAASPIGDPPLFMGYLQGVNFFWFIKHMFWHILLVTLSICAIFFAIDKYLWHKNDSKLERKRPPTNQSITVVGKRNIILLAGILCSLVFCDFHGEFTVYGTEIKYSALTRDILLVIISVLSILLSPLRARKMNEFSYAPIIEVAETFIAIFVTVEPVLDMLALGAHGPMHGVFSALSPNGMLDSLRCFWGVGMLSAFLDNAPTFLIFFFLAGGNAVTLMTTNAAYLITISLGTVFMGAMTYIGNAPNLMMKSIAVESGIKMPSFFVYMLLTMAVLLPIFFILSLVL